MKFLDRFRRTTPATNPEPGPAPSPEVLLAPLDGTLQALDTVPDPVFAGRMLGDGLAIDPATNVLCAPFAGTVVALPKTRHAITLRAANGAELLMHIGIETVGLGGDGFVAHVKEGQSVAAGDRLISFDAARIAPQVPSLVIPLIVTNGDDFVLRSRAADGSVKRGARCCEIVPAAIAGSSSMPEAPPEAVGEVFHCTSEIRDPFGIHARPAGVIATRAKAAASRVTLSLGGRRADARSSVAIMLMGAQAGDVVHVEAIGPTAQKDAQDIAELIAAPGSGAAAREPRPASAPAPALAAKPLVAVALDAPGIRRVFSGVSAAPGLAVGVSRRLVHEQLDIPENGAGIEQEMAALTDAIARTRSAIESAIAHFSEPGPVEHGSHGNQQTEILTAHLSFLDDPYLRSTSDEMITAGRSAAFAWKNAVETQITALRQLGNEVLAERAADLLDIERRVLLVLCGRNETALELPDNAILFADDLLPSQFADLDLKRVAGICLAASGPTSHVAILLASYGIAAIVAAGPDTLRVPDGQDIIIDADKGQISVNPAVSDVAATRQVVETRRARVDANRQAAGEICRMPDGTRIEVVANLGSVSEVAGALANGAEGCGLLRSEFLYLHRTSAPGEDEQFAEYQAIATALAGRPLVIRTLDAGADKDVPYAHLPTEENPALGLRGVRLSLWQPDLLRTQVRAILRVKPYGQCKILLPMIATLADVRTVKAVIAAESEALGRDVPIETGIMVEVPSVALIAAQFAEEVDFFSVGTNDLTQYTLAMDRCNARLAQQLDPFHPAVLRLIGLAADGARNRGRWVGVCGNIASSPLAAPLLIGLGVTELSATANAIADIKALVRTLDMPRCRAVAEAALALDSADDVRHLVATHWPTIGSGS